MLSIKTDLILYFPPWKLQGNCVFLTKQNKTKQNKTKQNKTKKPNIKTVTVQYKEKLIKSLQSAGYKELTKD